MSATQWFLSACIGAMISSQAAAAPLDRAERLLSERQFEAAVLELEPLAEANPYDGLAAYYLGVSLARTGRCNQAMARFDAALAAGVNGARSGMRSALLRSAECAAQLGEDDEAFARLRQAWARWGLSNVEAATSGEDFARLRASGRLSALTGRTPRADAGGENVRREADLAYFDRLIREAHPDPFHATSEAEWRSAIEALERRAPRLSGWQFNVELMRLAAMIGDGHTSVFPQSQGDDAWRLLPIYPLRLSDGWVIAAAAQTHADLVGARIEAVGGRPIEQVMEQLRRAVPGDNDVTARWLAGLSLQTYEAFAAIDAAEGDAVRFDLTLADGAQRSVLLAAAPIERDPNARWAPRDWPTMGAQTLWLRDPQAPFATHWFANERVLYAQVNQVANADSETLAAFGERLSAQLRETEAQALIIDLRHNNGGNANLAFAFLRAIDRHEPLARPGALIALTGPRSYSATIGLLGRLERDMNATIIGWPSGGRPVGYSTEREFTLPYSGISGTISARYHVDGFSADDARPWIAPDVLVWPSRADVLAGRDPVLEAALAVAAAGPD